MAVKVWEVWHLIAGSGKDVGLVNSKSFLIHWSKEKESEKSISNMFFSSKNLLSEDERKNYFNAFTKEEEVTERI